MTVLELYDSVQNMAKKTYEKADFSNINPIPMLILGFSVMFLMLKKLINGFKEPSSETTIDGVLVSEDTVTGGVAEATLGKQNVKVNSPFGAKRPNNRKHKGIDLKAAKGDLVYAPFKGTIINAKNSTSRAGGRTVVIKADDGNTVVMVCHLSSVRVNTNQKVEKGTVIGTVGGSGFGSESYYSPHLHLQVGSFVGSNIKWVNPIQPQNIVSVPNFKTKAVDNDSIVAIMRYFIAALNLKPEQASGLCANLYAESGFDPSAYTSKNGGRGAMGIAGWRRERITKYEQMFHKNQRADANLQHQLQYVVYELSSVKPYTYCLSLLRKSTNPEQSADVVLGYYEFQAGLQSAVSSLGVSTWKKRRRFSQQFYQLYLSKGNSKGGNESSKHMAVKNSSTINNYSKHTWH